MPKPPPKEEPCELSVEALELLFDETFRVELQEMYGFLERIAIALENLGVILN